MLRRAFTISFAMVLAVFTSLAFAEPKEEKLLPDALISSVTEGLLSAVEKERENFGENPEPFYQEVESLVLPLMDMRSFARGVMGQYGSSKAYRALKTKEEKDAFKARVVRFADVFKVSMVRTYSKGLMTFTGQDISVVPFTEKELAEITASGRAEVRQLVARENDEPYELKYSFARNKGGDWLARNVLVDGINLGRVYQSQFAQAVIDNDGDVDAAIDNWSATLATDEAEQAESASL